MSGGGRDEAGVTGDLSSRRLFNIFKRNSAFVGKFGIFYTGSQDVCSRCLKQRNRVFLMRPRSSPAVFVVTTAGVSFKETWGQMHTYIYWCHVGFEWHCSHRIGPNQSSSSDSWEKQHTHKTGGVVFIITVIVINNSDTNQTGRRCIRNGSDLLGMPLQSFRSITTRRNWIFPRLSRSSAILPYLQPAAASAGYTAAYLPQYRRNQLSGQAGLSRHRAQINFANALKYPELFLCVVLSALHVLWQARK